MTWHTFECPYSVSVETALKILIKNGSEAFVFHPHHRASGGSASRWTPAPAP
jgi:hypothetical protein